MDSVTKTRRWRLKNVYVGLQIVNSRGHRHSTTQISAERRDIRRRKQQSVTTFMTRSFVQVPNVCSQPLPTYRKLSCGTSGQFEQVCHLVKRASSYDEALCHMGQPAATSNALISQHSSSIAFWWTCDLATPTTIRSWRTTVLPLISVDKSQCSN